MLLFPSLLALVGESYLCDVIYYGPKVKFVLQDFP